MANAVADWVLRRQKFCCCLPVRAGVIVMSFLTILLAGLLAIVLWYEVSVNSYIGKGAKAALVVAGVVETALFIVSALGFVGACARKQLFVVIYATFLYFHFIVNLGVATYFLWMITHAANSDIVRACEEGIRSEQAQRQCTGLLDSVKGLFWGVSITVLVIELYCALIVTRYVNQLRYEKRSARTSRIMHQQRAYEAFHQRVASSVSDRDGLLSPEFEPYRPSSPTLVSPARSAEVRMDESKLESQPEELQYEDGDDRLSNDVTGRRLSDGSTYHSLPLGALPPKLPTH